MIDRTAYNPLNADLTVRDVHGMFANVAGRIEPCYSSVDACMRGRAHGRFHHLVVPSYAADRATLVMAEHHFSSREAAHAAYMAAREAAVVATSFDHRDELYARKVPVWIPVDLTC